MLTIAHPHGQLYMDQRAIHIALLACGAAPCAVWQCVLDSEYRESMNGMDDIYRGRLTTTVSLDLTPSPLLNRLNILRSQHTYSALSL